MQVAYEGTESVRVSVSEEGHLGAARRAVVELASALGFSEQDCAELAIVASELASNLVKYGRNGCIRARRVDQPPRTGIEVISEDDGPGIPELLRAQQDGFSTGGTLGGGLGAMSRLMDVFELGHCGDDSAEHRNRPGTRISCIRWHGIRTSDTAIRASVRTQCIPGESVCGDRYLIDQSDGTTTLCVVDGLGHGPLAHEAAEAAVASLRDNLAAPLKVIFARADAACRGTRGAVMTVAKINPLKRSVACAGVGNVTLRIFLGESAVTGINSRGTLGRSIGTLRTASPVWMPGSILCLYSDGLRDIESQRCQELRREDVDTICRRLFDQFQRGTDDATLVVAKATQR